MTGTGIVGRLTHIAIGVFALLAAPLADPAAAQDTPGPAVELTAAWVGFADDSIVGESVIGGAGRWYLLPQISVGPEIAYIQAAHHSHLVDARIGWELHLRLGGLAGIQLDR